MDLHTSEAAIPVHQQQRLVSTVLQDEHMMLDLNLAEFWLPMQSLACTVSFP